MLLVCCRNKNNNLFWIIPCCIKNVHKTWLTRAVASGVGGREEGGEMGKMGKMGKMGERGGGVTPPIIFLSRQLVPQLANEASKVLEQGLIHNKCAVCTPRAMGLQTGFANVLCNTWQFTYPLPSPPPPRIISIRVTNRLNSNQWHVLCGDVTILLIQKTHKGQSPLHPSSSKRIHGQSYRLCCPETEDKQQHIHV